MFTSGIIGSCFLVNFIALIYLTANRIKFMVKVRMAKKAALKARQRKMSAKKPQKYDEARGIDTILEEIGDEGTLNAPIDRGLRS